MTAYENKTVCRHCLVLLTKLRELIKFDEFKNKMYHTGWDKVLVVNISKF